jgi:hypothetical protein
MILLDTNVVIDAQNKTSPFFNCFLRTKMDLLVLGNFHIQRKSRDEQEVDFFLCFELVTGVCLTQSMFCVLYWKFENDRRIGKSLYPPRLLEERAGRHFFGGD